MQPESEFKKELIKAIESVGGMCIWIASTPFTGRGWPDLFVTHRKTGGFFLEAKHGRNKCDTLQRICIADLKMRGTPAFVIRKNQNGVFLEDEEGRVLSPLFLSDPAHLLETVNAQKSSL